MNKTNVTKKQLKVAIISPTYNEAKNITRLIKELSAEIAKIKDVSFTLFVVDDSSPDNTAEIAKNAARAIKQANFDVTVLTRKEKDGLGKAYVYGFKHILKKPYDFLMEMDADLSHNPKYLPQFIEAARNGADLVVASRYIKGGATPDWGIHRQIMSRGGNLYTRLFMGSKITDYTGGYNFYRADLIKAIDLDALQAGGYGFQLELKYRAMQHTSNIKEIPIVFMDREHGKSKMPKSTLIKSLILVPQIRFGK